MLRAAIILLLTATICWAEDAAKRPTKLACYYSYDAERALIVVRIFNCGSEPIFIEETDQNGMLRRINKDGEVDAATSFCDDPRFETHVDHNRHFVELPPVGDLNAESLQDGVTDKFLLKALEIQIDAKRYAPLEKGRKLAFDVERDCHCDRPLVAQLKGEVRLDPDKKHYQFKALTIGDGLVRPIKPPPATKGKAEQGVDGKPPEAPQPPR
jgi:hypothetical protein